MITLFRYTKLFAWLGIYKYYPSDIVEDIIIKNINDCGCVVIKFFQWIAPIIEMSEKKEQLFPIHKLDSIYENCNVIEEFFGKSGLNVIKFMSSQGYMKYLVKKGLIERKVIKNPKNSQEIYKTG